jgi:hypothetical protein
MSDMIAKVSRAIIACGESGKTSSVDYARAAIRAMREPTDEMLMAAGTCEAKMVTFEYNHQAWSSDDDAISLWHAMIDAAVDAAE